MSPVCPLCGSEGRELPRFKGVCGCRRHGGFEWFARESLEDHDFVEIYQGYPYNRSVMRDFDRMSAAYAGGLRRRILKHHPRTEGLSFLDVGCANGEYLRTAVDLGMRPVAGVEIDEEAKAKASAYGRVGLSMDDFPGRFDVVQCKNVLSNIADFRAFFRDLLDRTKPGGVLFLDVLNQFGIMARLKKTAGKPGILRPPFVINGFSKGSVRELARGEKAEVAGLGTTYVGSDLLPYTKSVSLLIRGGVTRLFGAASMIAADIVPAGNS